MGYIWGIFLANYCRKGNGRVLLNVCGIIESGNVGDFYFSFIGDEENATSALSRLKCRVKGASLQPRL